MEQVCAEAIQMQRNEHRLREAIEILEQYDRTEPVPAELTLKVTDYQADAVGAKCTLSIRNEKDYPDPPPDFMLGMLGLK